MEMQNHVKSTFYFFKRTMVLLGNSFTTEAVKPATEGKEQALAGCVAEVK